MNQLHYDLFKLFILASNDRDLDNPYLDEYSLNLLILFYPLQYNDRSIAPIKYSGYVSRDFVHNAINGLDGYGQVLSEEDDEYRDQEIRFYFVEGYEK
jgi:hypothetical protein